MVGSPFLRLPPGCGFLIQGIAFRGNPAMAPNTPDRPACPACSGHGIARSVLIKSGLRTVTYECDSCQQKWDTTATEARSGYIKT